MDSSQHGTVSQRHCSCTLYLIIIVLGVFSSLVSMFESKLSIGRKNIYNIVKNVSNTKMDENDYDLNYINVHKWAPMMLVNIGTRSAGTSEFAGMINKYRHSDSALCPLIVQDRDSGKLRYGCGEFHYWDGPHCINTATINYSKSSYVSSKLLNNSIMFELNDNYELHIEPMAYNVNIAIEFEQEIYFCNSKDYINNWINHYRIIKHLNLTNDGVHIIKKFSNKILFEKSPRYYMYPHISFIFANSVSLKRSKIILFLRDPIKSFLSGYYDAATKELKQENENFVSKQRLDNLLNQLIFNNMHEMEFVIKLLSRYITDNNQFISNENNINNDLIDTYNKIDFFWKKYNYAHDIDTSKDSNDTHHKPYVFRSCHIMLLISWFKDFGYFDDNNENRNLNILRNRFKIIQSEYYFANEEQVFTYLIKWTLLSDATKYRKIPKNIENIDSTKVSFKKKTPRHSKKWRPDLSNETLDKIEHFYFPCTAHTIHFLQTNEYKKDLIYGVFDPTLWKFAMKPQGQTRMEFF